MKVDTVQCGDYSNYFYTEKKECFERCYKPICDKVDDLIRSISVPGPNGRSEFDTADFYAKFDAICNAYRDEKSYTFVSEFVRVFMQSFAAGISVAENSHHIHRVNQELRKR